MQKFHNMEHSNSRTFQGLSRTFKDLFCFQGLSRAWNFFLQIQGLSRTSQGPYKPYTNVSATCFHHLCRLRHIRWMLTAESAATLVHAFWRRVWMSFLPKAPKVITNKLQCVMNAAAAFWHQEVRPRLDVADAWLSPLAWRAWARQVQSHHLDSSLPHRYRATLFSCRLCSSFRDGTETSSTLRHWSSARRAVVPSELMWPSGVFYTQSETMELFA